MYRPDSLIDMRAKMCGEMRADMGDMRVDMRLDMCVGMGRHLVLDDSLKF